MGTVQFVGPGPYDLPVTQAATATAVGNTVVVSIRLLADPTRLENVRIAMLPNQAAELLAALGRATEEALRWEREKRK